MVDYYEGRSHGATSLLDSLYYVRVEIVNKMQTENTNLCISLCRQFHLLAVCYHHRIAVR